MSFYLLDHHRNRHKSAGPAGHADTRPWYTTRNRCQHGIDGPHLIVIHTPETLEDFVAPHDEAERVAAYGANTTRASWHATIDADSTIPMLPSSYTAWHVRGYNRCAIGYEIGAKATSWTRAPTRWVEGVLARAAAYAAVDAKRYRIPPVMLSRAEVDRGGYGFIGHGPLDPGRRTDPGQSFPWTPFLNQTRALIHNPTPAPTPGGTRMDLASARIEVARIWAKALGQWPTGTKTETAQQRLTRLAGDLAAGRLTTAKLFQILEPFAPDDLAARRAAFFKSKAIPAWILVPGLEDSYSGESGTREVARLPKKFRATIEVDGV